MVEPFKLDPVVVRCIVEWSLVGGAGSEPSIDEMDMLLSGRVVGRAGRSLAPVKEGGNGMLGRDG